MHLLIFIFFTIIHDIRVVVNIPRIENLNKAIMSYHGMGVVNYTS